MSKDFESYAKGIIKRLKPFPMNDGELQRSDEYRDALRERWSSDDFDAGILDAIGDLRGGLIDANTGIEEMNLGDAGPGAPRGVTKEVSSDETEALQEGIWRYGFEVLGFYKSYRHADRGPFPNYWGIFVLDSAISHIADDIMDWYPTRFSRDDAEAKAYKMIHAHERFHFRFDAWALHLEEVAGIALYEGYKEHIHQKFFPHILVVEESLANNHVVHSMRGEGIAEYLRDLMNSQPAAYREYQEQLSDKHDGAELNRGRLCAQILNPVDVLNATPAKGAVQAGWMRRLSRPAGSPDISQDNMCPAYKVSGARISNVMPPSTVGAPPLNEMTRFVKKYLGGKLLERTDHDYYRIDNGEKIKMPNSHSGGDRCKPWEFKGIRMKAGMKSAEYKSARSKTRSWRKNTPRTEPKHPLI
jgi:hypothetical protein